MLSRFWYFVIAAATIIALLGMFAVVTNLNRTGAKKLESTLSRDHRRIEQSLQLEARRRMDATAGLAANATVREVLYKSLGNRPLKNDDVKRLERKLVELNQQLGDGGGHMLFAVSADGTIIGQLGGTARPKGAGLGAFPLVRRALAGYVGDDTWVYGNNNSRQFFRVAARPAVHNGQYVGAIIHAVAIDESFVKKLGQALGGASVAIYFNDAIVGSDGDVIGDGSMVLAAIKDLDSDNNYVVGKPTPIVEINDSTRAIFSKMRGQAGEAGLGFGLIRSFEFVGSPLELVAADDVSAIEPVWLGIAAGAPIILAFFGLFLSWIERDRPLGLLKKSAAKIASGEAQSLPGTKFKGGFRKLVEDINVGLGGGGERSSTQLDAFVNEAATSSAAKGYFDMGASDEVTGTGPGVSAPFNPPAPAMPAGNAPLKTQKPFSPPAEALAPPPSTQDNELTMQSPLKHGRPNIGLPAPPEKKVSPIDELVMSYPAEPMGKPAPEPFAASSTPGFNEATVSAPSAPQSEPTAVSDSVRPLGESPTVVGDVAESLEDIHYRQVFEKFVRTKTSCGESTEGLRFEKFRMTLRSKREQIAKQHNVDRVVFDVYVKAGKAALKATPIRANS